MNDDTQAQDQGVGQAPNGNGEAPMSDQRDLSNRMQEVQGGDNLPEVNDGGNESGPEGMDPELPGELATDESSDSDMTDDDMTE